MQQRSSGFKVEPCSVMQSVSSSQSRLRPVTTSGMAADLGLAPSCSLWTNTTTRPPKARSVCHLRVQQLPSALMTAWPWYRLRLDTHSHLQPRCSVAHAQSEEELYLNVVVALDLLVSAGLAVAHWNAISREIEAVWLGPRWHTQIVSPEPAF